MTIHEARMGYYELLLYIGKTSGALSVPEIRNILAEALRADALSAGHIEHLRDQLTTLLADSAPGAH